jgi:Short C-terminal domain
MSDLQDQYDKGEISPEEYHARRDEQMAENERLYPGIHDRWYEYLMVKYPDSH